MSKVLVHELFTYISNCYKLKSVKIKFDTFATFLNGSTEISYFFCYKTCFNINHITSLHREIGKHFEMFLVVVPNYKIYVCDDILWDIWPFRFSIGFIFPKVRKIKSVLMLTLWTQTELLLLNSDIFS